MLPKKITYKPSEQFVYKNVPKAKKGKKSKKSGKALLKRAMRKK